MPERKRRRRPRPCEPEVIVELYVHLLENTETFETASLDLAYLWPEMLRGGSIYLPRNGPSANLLREHVPPNHPMWSHVRWLDD